MTTVLPFAQAKPFQGLLEPLFLWQPSPAPLLFHQLNPTAPAPGPSICLICHLPVEQLPTPPPPSTALVPTFLPNPQSSSQSWFQNPSQRLSILWSQRSEGLPFSLGIELTAPHTSPSYSPQLYVSHSALLLDVPQHPELIPAPGPLHWLLPLPGSFFPQMAVSFPPSLPSVLPKRYPTREGFPVPSFLRHDHSIQPPPPQSFRFLPCTFGRLYILHSPSVPLFLVPVFPVHTHEGDAGRVGWTYVLLYSRTSNPAWRAVTTQ